VSGSVFFMSALAFHPTEWVSRYSLRAHLHFIQRAGMIALSNDAFVVSPYP